MWAWCFARFLHCTVLNKSTGTWLHTWRTYCSDVLVLPMAHVLLVTCVTELFLKLISKFGVCLSLFACRYGLLGLLHVIRMTEPDLTMLALGTDLTGLGLNLNSPDPLYKVRLAHCWLYRWLAHSLCWSDLRYAHRRELSTSDAAWARPRQLGVNEE